MLALGENMSSEGLRPLTVIMGTSASRKLELIRSKQNQEDICRI